MQNSLQKYFALKNNTLPTEIKYDSRTLIHDISKIESILKRTYGSNLGVYQYYSSNEFGCLLIHIYIYIVAMFLNVQYM